MGISEKLLFLKQQSGWSAEELSRRSGVPLGTLNKMLSGQTRQPSAAALYQLSQALGVSMHYLLEERIPVEAWMTARTEEEDVRCLSQRESELLDGFESLTEHGQQLLEAVLDLLLYQSPKSFFDGPTRKLLCFQAVARGRRGSLGEGFYFRPIQALLDPVTREADFTVLLTSRALSPAFGPGTILGVGLDQPDHNQLGLFLVNREVYIRKLYRGRNKNKLVAVNLDYKDIPLGERDELKCLGTILGAVRNYRWL